MALVYPLEKYNFDVSLMIGDFFCDGKEYLAIFHLEKYVEFYLVTDYFLKVKTVNYDKYNVSEMFDTVMPYKTSSGYDSFILGVHRRDQEHKITYEYWDGKNLIRFLETSFEVSLQTCCLAPGMVANSLGAVYKDLRSHFRLSRREGGSLCILDLDTFVYFTYDEDGVINIVFNRGGEIISAWPDFDSYSLDGNDFAAYYLSQKDRSKVILYYDDRLLALDISEPEADDISDNYHIDRYLPNKSDIEFSHYDKVTGNAILYRVRPSRDNYFRVYTLFAFTNKSIVLETGTCDSIFDNYMFDRSNLYEITLDKNYQFKLVFKTALPIIDGVEHIYRDLAGTVYFDQSGIYRRTLVFETQNALSFNGINEVKDIFSVGEDLVLVSGAHSSVVVDVHTGEKVDTWHKPEATVFANDHFQVTNSKIYTKTIEADLPDVMCMFAMCGDKLAVGSSSIICIISEQIGIERQINDDGIYCVNSEGYITPSGIKFFDTREELPSTGLIDAVVVNNELWTVLGNGELFNTVSKQRVDLNLESTDYIYECGHGSVMIVGSNDSFLYRDGEFFSVRHGMGDKMIISKDKKSAISLQKDTVYATTGAGPLLAKKKIQRSLGYQKNQHL